MRRVIRPLLIVLSLTATASSADEPKKPADAITAATADDEAFKVLRQEYETKRDAIINASRAAKDTGELQMLAASNPLAEFRQRFLAFSKAHPKQKAGLRALLVLTEGAAETFPDDTMRWAFERITQDHIDDPEIVIALEIPPHFPNPPWEQLARIALARSPHRQVRGFACYVLGCYLGQMAPVVESYLASRKFQDDLNARGEKIQVQGVVPFDQMVLKSAIDPLLHRGPAAIDAEADRLLERARDEFGSVALPVGGTTVGALAKSELYDRRELAVGKTAPEVKGEDVDGRPMKLSDYRGKVVLLSFWETSNGLCMGLVPFQRELARKFEGRPFVLLGINGDEDRGAVKAWVAKERITWRSWWNGGLNGSITRQWNLKGWPTLIVIDGKGVIREKQRLEETSLVRFIDDLVREAENPEEADAPGR